MMWLWIAIFVLAYAAVDLLRRLGQEIRNNERDRRFARLLEEVSRG